MGVQFSLRRALRDTRALPALEPIAVMESDAIEQVSPSGSGASGLIGHYVQRERGRGPAPTEQTAVEPLKVVPIGRGTLEHAAATGMPQTARRVPRRLPRNGERVTIKQRLMAATLAATMLFTGLAQATSAEQFRYHVQPGDTLEGVAAEFGVDPEAIRRSSWFSVPGQLTPGDVIIIPGVGQAPEEAAAMAAQRAGTSPWAAGAHWVVAGDTIQGIADLYGIDAGTLLEINGLTWGEYIYPGDRLVIPGTEDGAFSVTAAVASSGSAASTSTASATSIWVPTYVQQRNLSCEYAAAFIATSAFGAGVPEWAFIERIPVTKNPHYGYRGNIDGAWGRYDDWGIYAEPLVPVLNDWGYAAEAFYSLGDPTRLIAHLDAGHPVVVWLAMWGDTGIVYQDEGTYTVFAGAHVMTAYGYDDNGVYLSDPGTGTYRYYDWGTFLWMWGTIDGMSLAIYPF